MIENSFDCRNITWKYKNIKIEIEKDGNVNLVNSGIYERYNRKGDYNAVV